MTYKAYIDNIRAKTGKTPEDYLRMAEDSGYFVLLPGLVVWALCASIGFPAVNPKA